MASNFKFNPPTRSHCTICEAYDQNEQGILDSHNAKASSASKFPVHNWYHFVLGYSPDFPNFILERENVRSGMKVVDPFMGAGTTLVACKDRGIASGGVDANNYFYDVVKVKTDWSIDTNLIERELEKIIAAYKSRIKYFYDENDKDPLDSKQKNLISFQKYAEENRPEMLVEKYVHSIPFAKLLIIKESIEKIVSDNDIHNFFDLALSSIVVPVSNVKYGPGFGVSKKDKSNIDVLSFFTNKVDRMISDLKEKTKDQINTPVEIFLADSRDLSQYFFNDSVDLMITSPPYPGDHEYTKHTRLELIFMEYAQSIHEFRAIKQRMIRGSTTNIYKADNDKDLISKFDSINKVVRLIDERLVEDNATSGFEKLYTRLVQEYFGGMYRNLSECFKVLKKGGKYSLLVSDSHAFKMVHIETAKILGELAKDIGYEKVQIELWQSKKTSSHSYMLRENIITITK